MRYLVVVLKALAVILISFFVPMIVAAASLQAGLVVAAFALITGLVCLVKPITAIWLGSRITSGAVVAITIVSLIGLSRGIKNNQLEELRNSNTKGYLAELKASNSPRWESELQALDKVEYDKLVELRAKEKEAAERRAKDEEAVRAKTAANIEAARIVTEREKSITRFRELYINMPREEVVNLQSNEWDVKFTKDSADLIQRNGDKNRCASISFDQTQKVDKIYFRKCFFRAEGLTVDKFSKSIVDNYHIQSLKCEYAIKTLPTQLYVEYLTGGVIDANSKNCLGVTKTGEVVSLGSGGFLYPDMTVNRPEPQKAQPKFN